MQIFALEDQKVFKYHSALTWQKLQEGKHSAWKICKFYTIDAQFLWGRQLSSLSYRQIRHPQLPASPKSSLLLSATNSVGGPTFDPINNFGG